MEHQTLKQDGHIEKTFYQHITNTEKEGIVFIDEGIKGYLQVHYAIEGEKLTMTLISRYTTLFSDRVKKMIPYERPKQVSKMDIIQFIKAYKESLYVF